MEAGAAVPASRGHLAAAPALTGSRTVSGSGTGAVNSHKHPARDVAALERVRLPGSQGTVMGAPGGGGGAPVR